MGGNGVTGIDEVIWISTVFIIIIIVLLTLLWWLTKNNDNLGN